MNWASLGQTTVWAILFGIAAYLYWRAVLWCADALYISDMREQERVSQGALLAVADYLDSLSGKKTAAKWDREPDSEWEGPFMDTQFPADPANDSLLYHQLKKSLERTKRGPDNAA